MKLKGSIFGCLLLILCLMMVMPALANDMGTFENQMKDLDLIQLSTSGNFIEYLKSQDCELSREAIEQFSNLNAEEQELFLKLMHPANFIQIIGLKGYECGTKGYLEVYGMEIPFYVISEDVYALESRELSNEFPIIIKINGEVEEANLSRSNIRQFTANADVTLSGVVVTRFSSTLQFTVNNLDRPTGSVHASVQHRNINPGLSVIPRGSAHTFAGGMALGFAYFDVRLNALPFVSYSVDLETRRNGLTNQARLQSTNPYWHDGNFWHTVR